MSASFKDLPALCVRRPVLAVVLNLLIVIAGAAALMGVEIRELPDVDRPVVSVNTTYSGAAPETIDAEVTSLVEGAVARVSGVESISSSSSTGSSRVTIEFSPDSDLQAVANDVRDAVATIQRRLPDGADAPIVVKADADASPIIRLAVATDTLPVDQLSRLVDTVIVDRLAAVDGVADVTSYGIRNPIFSITIDPVAMASRNISLAQLDQALSQAAVDLPAGTLVTANREILVRADATATTEDSIADLWIDGASRVGDVATVVLRPEVGGSVTRHNGQRSIGLGIVRQPSSDTIAISDAVNRVIAGLNEDLPGVTITNLADDAVFIRGAISEVSISLMIATAIVISVVFLFLGSGPATLVPAVTVPIAIIGTIAMIWLLGFSINLLTLLALVLATGLVVDDAIVVLESIDRRRAEGMGPRAAAVLGTRQVFFAVLATTATLAAVFVPLSFLPGTAGALFGEFGYVLAIAVVISSFVALTLCPMMASRLGTGAATGSGGFARMMAAIGRPPARLYRFVLHGCLQAPLVVVALAIGFAVFAWGVFQTLPQQLVPQEDRGRMFVVVSAPNSASFEYTEQQMRQVEALVEPLLDSGLATDIYSIAGAGRSSVGFLIVTLAPWDERDVDQQQIMRGLMPELLSLPAVTVFIRSPNSLGIRGGGTGLSFALTGTDYAVIADAADDLAEEMRERLPGLIDPSVGYDASQPQYDVIADREAAAALGVSIDSIAEAMLTVLDGRDIAEIYDGDTAIPIRVEAPAGSIDDPNDLENLYVPAADGRAVPLSSIINIVETSIATSLPREGQRRAVPVSASLAEGYPLGTAVDDLEALAAEVLPPGIGIIMLGDAAALEQTSSGTLITFGIALLVVLLVLAAQFESFVAAMIIIITVPLGLGAAVMAIALSGGSINIYSQIGLVMIVGLMAKNGILIVEFAGQLRDQGRTVRDAIERACWIRLRPVMMTMVSTVFAGLPLVLADGPGAEARSALGWIVVGGLGFATLFTLFVTPVAYLLLAGLSKPRSDEARRLQAEFEAAGRSVQDEQAAPAE
ncbi:MAG: efflux RND transporter permease subunit [Pseudomonadota bacterium]